MLREAKVSQPCSDPERYWQRGRFFFSTNCQVTVFQAVGNTDMVPAKKPTCGKKASLRALRWHCKPLALVCSHHGLATTDSQYPQRIPLHSLGFQPLHTTHSNFISNCLHDIEQHKITSRCQELRSQCIVNKLGFIGLMFLPGHVASVISMHLSTSLSLTKHFSFPLFYFIINQKHWTFFPSCAFFLHPVF